MANSKAVVPSDFSWSPEFLQELLPSAERTALLYHLSYLCLGSFPKLERLIRERAIETQMLFGSSETILLKCVGTSHNLVHSLFPMLMKAVEKNKPNLAVRYLEKARAWIDDIIRAVDDMVKRYEQQSRSVGTCTSDVFQEQKETEKQQTQHSNEMKSLEETIKKLEEEFKKYAKDIEEMEKKIEGKNSELQDHIKSVSRTSNGMGILAALVPFIGPIIKSIYDTVTDPGVAAQTQALNAELTRLNSEKSNLQNKEWAIQVKLTDLQLQLANSKIQLGVIPSPVHLKDVQQCLSRIQQILFQLKMFWEKVGSLLDTLKKKTFVDEDLIEDLDDMKDEFLQSIKIAGEYWNTFGGCCQSAQGVFSVQSKDAYKFLEINPSSLSEDERMEQYKSVMKKLNQISPQGSSKPAITECDTEI
ncbi:hypothetical protein Q8A67_024897 [Cirrhinus molitorella]|uniref:Uncharacterized protein n=1 Tax=Cirrhinus molitorella TaxID=172907 RepID=A0AA88P137_9TELE|nr:hypothetical protein Q8A67_024897 [Cirrhinus molitorella]